MYIEAVLVVRNLNEDCLPGCQLITADYSSSCWAFLPEPKNLDSITSSHHFVSRALVRQSAHPYNDLPSTAEEVVRLCVISPRDINELFARALVDLDVARAHVVFMSAQSHVSVRLIHETHQRLPVTSTQRAQAQSHAAPKKTKTRY